MKTALIISFYESSNLGDLALSAAIDRITKESGYKTIRYDFCNARKAQKDEERDAPKTNLIKKGLIKKGLLAIRYVLRIVMGEKRLECYYMAIRNLFSKRYKLLIDDIKRSDLIVFGGGNMIMDICPQWPYLINNYVRLINKYGKKYYFMYSGVGPLKNSTSIEVLRRAILKATKISVRDRPSERICIEIFKKNDVKLTADPVFILFRETLHTRFKNIEKCGNRIKIGVCVLGEGCFCEKEHYNNYFKALKVLIEQVIITSNLPVTVIMFSTEANDYHGIKRLYSCFNDVSHFVTKEINSLNHLTLLYEELDYLIGGRMHSMIIAQTKLLPHIGIIWQDKIVGYGQLIKAEDKMYTLNNITSDYVNIAKIIILESKNQEVIRHMEVINRQLDKIVLNGNVLP